MSQAVVTDDEVDVAFVQEVLDKYNGARGALIPVMQKVQTKFGYLPMEAAAMIARSFRMSVAQIIGVASFYAQFRLTPRGKYMIKVCAGTACHVKGSNRMIEVGIERLGVPPGETTPDKLFTMERVACIGACSLAPLITVNEVATGYLDKDSFAHLLKEMKEKEETNSDGE